MKFLRNGFLISGTAFSVRLPAAKAPPPLKFEKPLVRKGQMSFLFIRKHFVFSVKNSKSHVFYHSRRNIHSLGMHFIDPSEEGLFKFWMHSVRFPLSIGELQFFKSPFREIFLEHIFYSTRFCRRLNSLTMACL